MRERGRWWVVAAVLCGLGASCTSVPARTAQEHVWASRAHEYFAAFHDAHQAGFTNLGPFYTTDAHVDYSLLDHDGRGRARTIQAMRDVAQPLPVTFGGRDPTDSGPLSFDEPLYVSRDGAVDVARITSVDYVIPSASAYRIGARGIESQIWTGSVTAGEKYIDLDAEAPERIARAYVRAWASADPAMVAGLYGPHATVVDSLAGLTLVGSDRIGAAALRPWADGGLSGAVLREIPQAGGPAVYANAESTGSGPIDRIVVLAHVEGAHGCPGDVAVLLHLDGSTILAEERYHRIDSPVQCWRARPAGWWDAIRIPPTRSVVRTGSVSAGGLEVAVWNGTPDPSPLITWGLQRFADAGLPAPVPTSVTFLPRGADPWLEFGFEEGTTAPDLALALPASEACLDGTCTSWPSAVKAAMLHQLAHLSLADPWYPRWDDPLTGPSRMAPFLAEQALTWMDPNRPWAEQASQLAAETLAWGLMDEPHTVDARMGSPSCTQLAADFALLTGSTPDPRACASGAEGPDEPGIEPALPLASSLPRPTGTIAPAGPAAAAERWFESYDAALDRGILDLYGYYSATATLDHRALGTPVTSGRDALRQHLTTMAGAPLLQRELLVPLHVSASAAVRVMALPGSTMGAFVMSLAATGITLETYAPSLVTMRSTRPSDDRLAVLQRFADTYIAAWAGQDRSEVADLYTPDAHLDDELLLISTTRTDEVRALAHAAADAGGLPEAALVALPELGGPAVFATGDSDPDDPLDTVVLLVVADSDCPSHIAVVLQLDAEGRITGETRLHMTADLDGCSVPVPHAAPWWEGLAIPPGVSVGRSGTLTVADRTIEVRSSSPALDRLLAWGLERFTESGLVEPALDSVTFVDRKAPACTGINGLAVGGDVSLCFGTSDACTDDGCAGWRAWAKKALLHELSHVWMTQNVTPETQTTLVHTAGLGTWESAEMPWGERGVELAAETIAGSLMDDVVAPNVRLTRSYSCAQWVAMYRLITGQPPVDPTCTERGA